MYPASVTTIGSAVTSWPLASVSGPPLASRNVATGTVTGAPLAYVSALPSALVIVGGGAALRCVCQEV